MTVLDEQCKCDSLMRLSNKRMWCINAISVICVGVNLEILN